MLQIFFYLSVFFNKKKSIESDRKSVAKKFTQKTLFLAIPLFSSIFIAQAILLSCYHNFIVCKKLEEVKIGISAFKEGENTTKEDLRCKEKTVGV
ncbi:hypothetical protein [Candidatus Protochlamydia sp. R18]|uniref:hypothetical protein n=1 Tax=Candidatus Protochlamydia sp. R18 TaxID=1353977 RepID=UPI0005A7FE3F|nr:hypothetical protein [Candidatus Protochlamydia sp. R18]